MRWGSALGNAPLNQMARVVRGALEVGAAVTSTTSDFLIVDSAH